MDTTKEENEDHQTQKWSIEGFKKMTVHLYIMSLYFYIH